MLPIWQRVPSWIGTLRKIGFDNLQVKVTYNLYFFGKVGNFVFTSYTKSQLICMNIKTNQDGTRH